MGERRRYSTTVIEQNDEMREKLRCHSELLDTSQLDFVKRSEPTLRLHGYHYRLDGYYMKRSAKSINSQLQELGSVEEKGTDMNFIQNDTKAMNFSNPHAFSSTDSSPAVRSDLSSVASTPSQEQSKSWSSPQKPRTVKQQKNKRRQREMEKGHSKNERWRCLSESERDEYRQVTIIPVSYDERAIDCEGLDERKVVNEHIGSPYLQSASSTISVSSPFDTAISQKTKAKRSRFRPLSQIFNKKSATPYDLNSAISELDLARWTAFQQYTPESRRRNLYKAKSNIDMSSMISSSKNQVTLLGRATDPKKFSTSTDEFRKNFVQGLWTSPKSGRPPIAIPNRKEKAAIPESTTASKSVDSGYDSPETGREVNGNRAVEKALADKPGKAYDRFDSRKASLFNEYFANRDEREAQKQTEGCRKVEMRTESRNRSVSIEKTAVDHGQIDQSGNCDQAVQPRNRLTSHREDNRSSVALQKDEQNRVSTSVSTGGHWPVVIAIDFGTSFSGYAYAFRGSSDQRVYLMHRLNTNDPRASSPKCPTCILLDPDGRFHSFGWEARDAYHDLEPEDAQRYLYFEAFKMVLGSEKDLKKRTMVPAINGTLWPAIDVMAHCLRYLKHQALSEVSGFIGSRIDPLQVQWVVTVPAIWRQSAKQMMRVAAYQAGLVNQERANQLIVALEPEAASLYCTTLKQDEVLSRVESLTNLCSLPSSIRRNESIEDRRRRNDSQAVQLEAGDAYVVVDCGGGTVDVTVHQLVRDGEIVELHKASGGPHGSTEIDQAFESLLCDIFGIDFMNQFRTCCPAGFLDLLLSFENRKRSAHPFKTTPFNVALPFSFLEFYKRKFGHRVECAVKRYEKKHVTWNSQGMLRLSADLMNMLFMPTLVAITKLIDDALEAVKPIDVSFLFMVGGFAESPLLQQEVRNVFESRLKIIIPNQTSTAVLRGAVLYGLHPEGISVRRSRMTYGISVLHPFDPQQHPSEKLVSKNGRDWCKDVFEKFVCTNQSITFDQEMVRHYCPASNDQTQILIQIFCSESADSRFVTDPGVEKCGVLKMELPKSGIENRDKEIKASVKFGGTELSLEAVDVFSGDRVTGCIDFL